MIKGFVVIIQYFLLLLKVPFLKKEKKSIAILFQSPHIGGVWTYLNSLVSFLKDNNYSIKLFFAKGDYDDKVVQFCKQQNIHFSVFDYPVQLEYFGKIFSLGFLKYTYNYFKNVNAVFKEIIKLRAKNIIISSGWPFYLFYSLFLPGRKFFIQHVMPLHAIDNGNGFLLKLALFMRQGTFIAVSDFAKRKMKQYWLKGYPKSLTIYNFYEKKKDISLPVSGRIQVLSLARVEDGKNPLLWIEIAEDICIRYENVDFVWAGKGSLLSIAKEKTINNPRISFIGFVTDVDSLYAKSDIYFEPSKREAHGISVVGAMAWGIPAIATNNGGTTESVDDGETGFIVDVSDKAQMLARLERLIEDEKLRISMKEESQKRYRIMFTKEIWEMEMNKLL